MNLAKAPYLVLAAALVVTATGIACRKAPANVEQADTQPMAARNSPMPVPPAAAHDLRFIDTMSKHHAEGKSMAEMAQAKLEHPGLKALARAISVDQQKEIDQMSSWRAQWYAGAPAAMDIALPGMSPGMNMDMSHMETMTPGPSYDVMFIDMMVPHHESAVAMARAALGSAERQEIKTLAQQIIDMQTKEIGQMKEWKAALAGSAPH